ncbi:unnamed protein product, partial [marine sediment metagenome]
RTCESCQYKVIGYEHSKVCDKQCRLILDINEAIDCKDFKQYTRWNKLGNELTLEG